MLEYLPRSVLPRAWENFEMHCREDIVVSDRESKTCLENELLDEQHSEWIKRNTRMFKPISMEESVFLGEMMASREFDFLNTTEWVQRRSPEGIPFVICIAKIQDRVYVYQKNTKFLEIIKKICEKYAIKYIEVEEYLLRINKS